MNESTQWLEPNSPYQALGFFFKALPYREWWTLNGIVNLFIDSVWH